MQPIILPTVQGATPLYRQVINHLALDTDPTQGIVPALGNGVSSIYPNFTANPSADRAQCPTPFILCVSLGKKRTNDVLREETLGIEVHDDPDMGSQRWPGILNRLKWFFIVKEWRPTSDDLAMYRSGLYFSEESPPEYPDTRYGTLMTQLLVGCLYTDRTSGHGRPG